MSLKTEHATFFLPGSAGPVVPLCGVDALDGAHLICHGRDPLSMIGQKLSHYRILNQIGAGGMGTVYRAHDERLDRDVALKVLAQGLADDKEFVARFRREARTLSKLNHPNIATVHDYDSDAGTSFLVMELIQGPSLSSKVRSGPVPEVEIVRLGLQLLQGLRAAHAEGIIHRDL